MSLVEDKDDRAEDLVLRLSDLRFEDCTRKNDLLGMETSGKFRTLCLRLAEATEAAVKAAGTEAGAALAAALAALKHSCSGSVADAGQITACLKRAASAVGAKGITDRLDAIEAIAAFLQASRILLRERQAQGKAATSASREGGAPNDPMETDEEPSASEASALLHQLASDLQIDSREGSAASVLGEVKKRLDKTLSLLPEELLLPVVPSGHLSSAQLELLSEVYSLLDSEYRTRRQVLLERTKVTLQSFLHSDRLRRQGTKAEAEALVEQMLSVLASDPSVRIEDIHSVRYDDLVSIAEQTTSRDASMAASVKSLLIGHVPDRGGRVKPSAGTAQGSGAAERHPGRKTESSSKAEKHKRPCRSWDTE